MDKITSERGLKRAANELALVDRQLEKVRADRKAADDVYAGMESFLSEQRAEIANAMQGYTLSAKALERAS